MRDFNMSNLLVQLDVTVGTSTLYYKFPISYNVIIQSCTTMQIKIATETLPFEMQVMPFHISM